MSVDCILIDTTHDESGGFCFVDAVRQAVKRKGSVPPAIIGMTGATDLAALKRLFAKHVDDLLLHPSDSDAVLEAFMRGAALTRLRRELLSSRAIQRLSHINLRMQEMDLHEGLRPVVPKKNLSQVLRAFEDRASPSCLGM
ncbi:hypothetical protein ECTOBSL9_2745 [Ectothiorhodospira sp. BSL-9]|nr:hypothetical protein ECTOBSL9_2745 [Ectothiorhodospira sp. BSL-9]